MSEITSDVNWLAVIVGAVVAYALGALWYSPKLFGTKWAEGSGVSMDPEAPPPMLAMVIQAIGTFLLAWIIGVTAVSNALLTAILIVLTIVFLMIAGGLYSQKSRYAITVEAAYVVVMAVVMIICQGIF